MAINIKVSEHYITCMPRLLSHAVES